MKMDDSNEFRPFVSSDEVAILQARITQLELREQELLKQQQEQEIDFGQKRARFREMFLQKEAELKVNKDRFKELDEASNKTKSELEDIKMAISVSEANKEEEIAKIRQQCQQEIETMQALLREAAEEASSSTAAQYESERAKLKELNENYEEEIQTIRSKLSQERQLDKGKGFLSSVADIVTRGSSSLSQTPTETENLEVSMRKAQQDAEILKSVVMPLEKEIEALKQKIQQQTEHIRSLEKQKCHQLASSSSNLQDLSSPIRTTLPSLEDVTDPEDKIEKLMKYLKAEKASRMDLEMYVVVLTTQKNVLQGETDKLRKEFSEVCSILDEEKHAHNQLKETWTMANDQFLESQRLMMMDMRRMESLLSAEQQRLLAEQQKKDIEREAQEKKVHNLEEMRQRQEHERQQEAVKIFEECPKETKKIETRLHDSHLKDINKSTTSLNSVGSENSFDFDDSFAGSEIVVKKSHSTLDIPSVADLDTLNSSIHETKSLTEMDNLTIRISPEKVINLPSLTEAQVRAITDPTPDTEVRRHLIANAKSKTDNASLEGKRLVSEKAWTLVQQELKVAREKLGRPCDMCNNYEAQLQTVQDEYKEEQAKSRSLDRELKAEKQTIESQKNYIIELEESLKDAANNANNEIAHLVNKVKECEKYIADLKNQFTSSQMEVQDALKHLTAEREDIQNELTNLQEENDTLQGRHSKHAEQLLNEDIQLPNNLDDMQMLLLKYREEIIAAKVSKEHTEESLKSKIMFLKDQVLSEQQQKSKMEEAVTLEINSLQERLAIQDSLKSELEREASVRAEAETKVRELEQSLKSQQAKSKQLLGGLQKELEEQANVRNQMENDNMALKRKVQSLQGDLENSEAVQRDFVKLSQSLQIQLEQIRQSENEVRWQNEEDVDDCHSCKQLFSVSRRKYHCRHCGKIFCSDCITKSVNTGPKSRPAKVCDVCHTILVKDATPFFSSNQPYKLD